MKVFKNECGYNKDKNDKKLFAYNRVKGRRKNIVRWWKKWISLVWLCIRLQVLEDVDLTEERVRWSTWWGFLVTLENMKSSRDVNIHKM